MNALLQIIVGSLLLIAYEVLPDLGIYCLAEPFVAKPKPFFAAMGYFLLGAIAGGLSLWPFPSHLVASTGLRILNLIITPIGVGLVMAGVGAWRMRRGRAFTRINWFAYGYLFALSLAVVRFAFAK